MAEETIEWIRPTAPGQRMAPDEVHVWRVSLEQHKTILRRFHACLSPEERERLERFQFPHLKRRFLASHGALRSILSQYLDVAPEKLTFAREKYGKPRLVQETQENGLAFNLAHSHELALVALTLSKPVGVDVEYQRDIPDADAVASRFFSTEEYEAYSRQAPEGRQEAFYRCWTRKEAFIKAVGEGLSYPLDTFSVTFDGKKPPRLLHIGGSREAAREWSLYSFEPGEKYTAALAARGNRLRLAFWNWAGSG